MVTDASLLVAYLRHRPGLTALNVLLVALATALLVASTLAVGQLERRLERDAAGVDLVVGAKGSPLQLILAGLYQVDVPPGNIPLASFRALEAERMVAQAIPLSLGDTFRGWRIVGTTVAYATLYGARPVRGALPARPMQAVLGSRVAAATGLDVGATFVGAHGLGEDGPEHADHVYAVTGVLGATGTVIDRLILTPLESVWIVHEGEPADEDERRALLEAREVTLALVRYATPLAAALLPRRLNAQPEWQAASPATEAARLFQLLEPLLVAVRALAALLLALAALSVFVALSQALADRQRELALMRLLGASPLRVFRLTLAEGVALAALGALAGLAIGHLGLHLVGQWLTPRGELPLTGLDFDMLELLWVGLAVAAGALAAVLPARRAARTPIALALAQTG